MQYTYTVAATSPCLSAIAVVDVTVFVSPSVVENISHVSCNGAGDASVDLDISPSSGNTVVWTLPTTNTVTQEDIGPVSDGDYDYLVTTADGCTFSNSITIDQPLPIDLVLNITPQTCPGSCDGEIIATSSNGIGNITYTMNGGNPNAGAFNNLCDGNLTITAIDGNGCSVSTNTTMTAFNPLLEPTINPVGNVCLSQGNINLTSDIAGGSWTGFGVVNGQTGEFDATQTGVGTFNVIYTIAGQCGGDDTLSVNVVGDPEGQIELSRVIGCAPLAITLTNPLADPNNLTCQWDLGNGDIQNSCAPLNYIFNDAGCYDISLLITDVNGCSSEFFAGQQVCVMGQPDANFNLNDSIFEEGSSELLGTAVDPVLPSYSWSFEGIAIGSQNEVAFETLGIGAGFYEICLSTENNAGCVSQTCQTVEYKESFTMYIPNSFTPNGDGINDLFFPVFFSGVPEEFDMYIFDRWGQVVLHIEDLNEVWDGRYKSDLAPQDTYVWKVKYKLFNETGTETKTGHVNLFR